MQRLGQVCLVAILFLSISTFAFAYEPGGPVLFVLDGSFIQETDYTYAITATPETFPSDVSLTMHVPVTRTWQYRRSQEISDLQQTWNPTPSATEQRTDAMGNAWSTASWLAASQAVEAVEQVTCREETQFEPIVTWDNYHTASKLRYPEDVRQWLEPDPYGFIQSDAPEIRQLARDLVAGAVLQIDVVGRILAWMHENVRAARCDEPDYKVDALGVLEGRVTDCVGFSNLSIALIRAATIPAIPVSGVVVDSEEPGVGHAWISVYFTDLGWFEFESSGWMPAYGEIPQTILTPQHITLDIAGDVGISGTPFSETHTCALDVLEKPRELGFVSAETSPGDALTWVISVRSPCYYEIYEWEYGYRDLPVSLSLDGVPAGWRVSLTATDLLIRNQELGASPTRSLLLTIIPAHTAEAGTQAVITVTARDTGTEGSPVIGTLTAAVTIRSD